MRTPATIFITRISQRISVKFGLWLGLYTTNYSISNRFASVIMERQDEEREKTWVNFYQTVWRNNLEDGDLNGTLDPSSLSYGPFCLLKRVAFI